MSLCHRLLACGAVAVLLLAGQPSPADDVAQQKANAVRTALERQGRAVNDPVLSDAAGRAAALMGIAVVAQDGRPRLVLHTTGKPLCDVFPLDRGRRIVLDLYNTVNMHTGGSVPTQNCPVIREVRTSLYALEPQFISRVILDMEKPCAVRLRRAPDDIQLEVTPLDRGFDDPASASQIADEIAADLARQQTWAENERALFDERQLRWAAERAARGNLQTAAPPEVALLRDRLDKAVAETMRQLSLQQGKLDNIVSALQNKRISERAAAEALQKLRRQAEQAKLKDCAEFAACAKAHDALLRSLRGADMPMQVAQRGNERPQEQQVVARDAAGRKRGPAPDIRPDSFLEALDVELARLNSQNQPAPAKTETRIKETALDAEPQPPVSVAAVTAEKPQKTSPDTSQPMEMASKATEAVEPTPLALATPPPVPLAATADESVKTASKDSQSVEAGPSSSDKGEGFQSMKDLFEVLSKPTKQQQTNKQAPQVALPSLPEPISPPLGSAEVAARQLAPAVTEAPKPAKADAKPAAPVALAQAPSAPASTLEPATKPEEPAPQAETSTDEQPTPVTAPGAESEPVEAETTKAEELAVVEAAPVTPPQPEVPTPVAEGARAQAEPAKAKEASALEPQVQPEFPELPPGVDPLTQPVNVDFRNMELSQVVSLLAHKAQINVVAGTKVAGTVTANLKNVPLKQAMETVLRLNGLGLVEEEGIFRIVTYEEAMAAKRKTIIIPLEQAQSKDVKTTLDQVLLNAPDAQLMSVSANEATNVIILAGPEARVKEFEKLVKELDVAEPTLPTATEVIKLNYADPVQTATVVKSMLTDAVGKVETDPSGRHLIVKDFPVAIEQIRTVIQQIDRPVKQVAIDGMVVDVALTDQAETGIDWLIDAINRRTAYTVNPATSRLVQGPLEGRVNSGQSYRVVGPDLRSQPPAADELIHRITGTIDDLTVGARAAPNVGANVFALTLATLSDQFDISAVISAEVANSNANIIANPALVTAENEEAMISIVMEWPYIEVNQTQQGGAMTNTEFKEIGTVLKVTPRVTHDNDILLNINAQQSSIFDFSPTGVPVTNTRNAQTSLRARDGQTVFIGGLRRMDDTLRIRKVPILGDVPIAGFLFRNTQNEKTNTELLVFLTSTVMGDQLPDLTPEQQYKHDTLDRYPEVPDAQRTVFRTVLKPGEIREPLWKWRRTK